MIRSGHVDTFARDNLPPQAQWPEFKLTLPELQYPDRLNCVTEYVDKWVAGGEGDRVAIISPTETLTYAQLAERINRIANVLARDLGMVPGNRVLMRSPNSPMGIAVYLAVIKAGGVMVATMPMLRAKELSYVVTKAKIKLALCDSHLADENSHPINWEISPNRRPGSAIWRRPSPWVSTAVPRAGCCWEGRMRCRLRAAPCWVTVC